MHTHCFIRRLYILCFCLFPTILFSQNGYSKADSLKGTLSPIRSCYDVNFYDLEIKIDPSLKRIAGSNEIYFTANRDFKRLQLDLSERYHIARITHEGRQLRFDRDHGAIFIDFPITIQKGTQTSIEIIYGGAPPLVQNLEEQEGFMWSKDEKGKSFIGVKCHKIGASSWWPLKDHPSDKPDSMRIAFIIPNDLMAISTGKYKGIEHLPGDFSRYTWSVTHPVNTNQIGCNIGDYVQIKDVFKNVLGDFVHLDYYVLPQHKNKIYTHIRQIKDMLRSYEQYLGPYPFWSDGLKVVESCFEHDIHHNGIVIGQSYINNKLDFDSLLLHQVAHRWFGSSISVDDYADRWIPEVFATYIESIYVESYHGFEERQKYLDLQRKLIKNQQKIIGPKGIDYSWEETDLAYKGSWMLHSLRQAIENDSIWFQTLKSFSSKNRAQIISTQDVIDFFNQQLDKDYSYLFKQYLTYTQLPVLEFNILKSGNRFQMEYRWQADESDFQLPIYIDIMNTRHRISPTTSWQTFETRFSKGESFRFVTEVGLYELREVEER